jgi:hypothetical protein
MGGARKKAAAVHGLWITALGRSPAHARWAGKKTYATCNFCDLILPFRAGDVQCGAVTLSVLCG